MTAIEMLKEFHFFDYMLTFFTLSFIGWVVESAYCSLAKGKFVNRGFLTGPLCPIYGTGAVVFMVLLTPFSERWYVVLLIGMVLADTVEYITSVLMEKLFHARWWDYSDKFLNINGRICLRHTCYWGIASLVYIYLFQPIYLKIYLQIPQKIRYIILGVIFFFFIIDLINAVKNAIDIRKFMNKLHAFSDSVASMRDEIKEKLDESKDTIGAKFTLRIASLYRQLDELRHSEASDRTSAEEAKTRPKPPAKNRMYRAYENIQSTAERTMKYAENILSEIKKRITDNDDEMF